MSRGCGNSNSYSQHSVCCLQLGIVQECFEVSSSRKKLCGRKRAMKREKIEEGKVIKKKEVSLILLSHNSVSCHMREIHGPCSVLRSNTAQGRHKIMHS